MSPDYEMRVNAAVTGTQQLEQLGTATEKQAERTKRLAENIQEYIAKNEKLSSTQAKLALDEVKLERLRERHRMQLESMAAQTEKLAAGQTTMASSTMAATTALKELESGFPIRSAARFLSTIEGIGPALQLAFPVLGAIAMAGAVNTIIDKVRDWARAHDPVVKAQNESLDILKRITREYESAKDKAKELRLEQIEITGGPDARRRAESFELGESASGVQQRNIQRLQNLQRVLQQVSGFAPNVASPNGVWSKYSNALRDHGLL
jgi:hypothetical protein